MLGLRNMQDLRRVIKTVLAEERRLHGRSKTRFAPFIPASSLSTIPFTNSSGETLPAYGVARVSAAVESGEGVKLTAVKPSTTFARVYLVNGGSAVANNDDGIGSFALHHPTKVLYDAGGTPAIGETWGAKPSNWDVYKNYPGFFIWGATNTGDGYVYATQEPISMVLGTLNSQLDPGDTSVSADIQVGAAGSETDSTVDVNAAEWMLQSGESVAVEKEILLNWINGTWYPAAAECSDA